LKITEKEVRYVADLGNLKLNDEEVAKFTKDLDEILVHMDKLAEIDTGDIAPMSQVLYEAEETATLRPDLERPPLGQQVALENSPQAGAGYFKVPRVIER
jgi:aspartyl-tRNA(Asn)/glutamyl-tRNA(Gln) amidotransferase subunit C